MGHDENEGGGAVDGLGEVRDRDDVVSKVIVGEVLDVLVRLVHNLGELAAVDLGLAQDGEGVVREEERDIGPPGCFPQLGSTGGDGR